MKLELGRDEIAEAIKLYVEARVSASSREFNFEVTQAKSAKATVTISTIKETEEDAG